MNKLTTYFTALLLLVVTTKSAQSQSEYDSLFVDSVLTNIVQEYNPTGFLKFYPDIMAPGDLYAMYPDVFFYDDRNTLEFEEKIENDHLNLWHWKYQQHFDDIPVEATYVIEHAHAEGDVIWMTGKVVDSLSEPDGTPLTEAQALDSLLANFPDHTCAWNDSLAEASLKLDLDDDSATYYPDGELIYALEPHHPTLEFHIPPSLYTLCWKFDLVTTEPAMEREFFVNAETGAIFKSNSYSHGGTAEIMYHHDTQYIDTKFKGGFTQKYILVANDGLHNFETKKTVNEAWSAMDSYKDSDDYFGTGHTKVTSPHYFVTQAWDYFEQDQGHAGPDGLGIDDLWVHADASELVLAGFNQLPGASYNGKFVDEGINKLFFGYKDGDYFCSMDIAGHEFTHSIIKNSSDLTYSGESGALNESFCDIFGYMVERRGENFDTSTVDWTLGEDANLPSRYERSLEDPKNFGSHYLQANCTDAGANSGQPDTYKGDFWESGDTTGCPGREMHTNSGVQNHWFYLTAVGGTGTNDHGVNYDIQAIGTDLAARIAFLTMRTLGNSAQYMDARLQSIQIAENLPDVTGPCDPVVIQTTNAWNAVGVGPISTCAGSNVENITPIFVEPVVFPNPTNNTLNIRFENKAKRNISLVNLTGQEAISVHSNQLIEVLNVSELSQGTYILRVTDSHHSYSEKVMVQ